MFLHTHCCLFMLTSSVSQSIIALSDTADGVIILPTVLYLSRVLAKVALGLDKNPSLVADELSLRSAGDADGAAEKVTFVESSANVLREAFIKCLADKSGSGGLAGAGRRGKPENKRTGIYMTANSCLKLLFQCRKLRNAQQMFVSIDAQSPLLSHYPAAQRVTYLYYLGRYLFANNHFYRALLALSSAYEQCHRQAIRQRQLILTYLITSNICLGRFPSSSLLARPEAAGLGDRFLPLCRIIARGDLVEFRHFLSVDGAPGQWFLRKRILLQLQSRCEILVWRSLTRKIYLTSGLIPGPAADDNRMPFLRLSYVLAIAQWMDRRQQAPVSQNLFGYKNGNRLPEYIDPEFEGAEAAVAETAFDVETGHYGESDSDATNGHISGDSGSQGVNGFGAEDPSPSMLEVESTMGSLLQQGLLRGFLMHSNPRWGILGARAQGGAMKAGFPNIWQTIVAKSSDEVPGWVRETNSGVGSAAPFGGMGGRIINLKGARPVGAGS